MFQLPSVEAWRMCCICQHWVDRDFFPLLGNKNNLLPSNYTFSKFSRSANRSVNHIFISSFWQKLTNDNLLSSVADLGCLSRIRIFSIPDPGSAFCIKEFKYFNPKKWLLSSQNYDPGCSSRIRIHNNAAKIKPLPGYDHRSVDVRAFCPLRWKKALVYSDYNIQPTGFIVAYYYRKWLMIIPAYSISPYSD
jgi:hypothetical protein